MKFGLLLKERMQLLNITSKDLARAVFVDVDLIEEIINNSISLEEINEYRLELISDVLYCSPTYFVDEKERKKDLVTQSYNRGNDDAKSIQKKAEIQNFVRDFLFINNATKE